MPSDQPPAQAFRPSHRPWSVRGPAPVPVHAAPEPTMRDTRYDIACLDETGMIEERSVAAPSDALFTNAFTAIARGGLVMTPDGPIAVEDLLPGDRVITHRGIEKLLWKGSRVVAPSHQNLTLYRIAADSLGQGRPAPDLLLGPAARLVSRRTALRTLIGADAALIPVGALSDGDAVIEIRPMSAIQVFHIGFARHTTFTVNGVELESVHPGLTERGPAGGVNPLYMSMFPHFRQPSDFGSLALERLQGDILAKITHAA